MFYPTGPSIAGSANGVTLAVTSFDEETGVLRIYSSGSGAVLGFYKADGSTIVDSITVPQNVVEYIRIPLSTASVICGSNNGGNGLPIQGTTSLTVGKMV